MTRFRRPIGANADLAELEYISALHQTSQELRPDGSINAIDISHFLKSRYGIDVTLDLVQKTILKGLGGGDDTEDCIDLTELVAIIIIPLLLKFSSSVDGIRPTIDINSNDFLETVENDIVCDVLKAILHDSTGDCKPKALDRDLIRDIFETYGESQLVDDDDLIDEMIEAANLPENDCDDSDSGRLLDKKSFLRALTSDVREYNIEWENMLSTHYFDVFQAYENESNQEFKRRASSDEKNPVATNYTDIESFDLVHRSSNQSCSRYDTQLKKVPMYPEVDYTMGAYRSKLFVVLLWFTAVCSYTSYVSPAENDFGKLDCEARNMNLFLCQMLNGTTQWLVIFFELSILGTAFICLGSVGHNIHSKSILPTLVGMISVIAFAILPYFVELETDFFTTIKQADGFEYRYIVTLFAGFSLLAFQLFHIIRLCIPAHVLGKYLRAKQLFTPSLIWYESNGKKAASYKTCQLVRNAHNVHDFKETFSNSLSNTGAISSYGRALLNFRKMSDKFEEIGSIAWVWKHLLNGSIYSKEGLWLPSRLVAANLSMLVVIITLVIVASKIVSGVNSLVDLFAGFDNEYLPKPWMLITAMYLGVFSALSATITLAVVYIPSAVSQVLQFRSGVLNSLGSCSFDIYRYSDNDSVSLVFGTIFWGATVTAVCVFGMVSSVIFFLVWQVTRPYVYLLLAQILGITVSIGIHKMIMLILRKHYFVAFYRKMPAAANFTGVVLQCWNLGITSGYVIYRVVYLLVATVLYAGRVDVSLLSDAVRTVGPVDLDYGPITFRKDLLAHEAHRHPYLERLGVMYLMKLKHGNEFARASGSCWRLLFVFALFPWLRKYRIEARCASDRSKWGSSKPLPSRNRPNIPQREEDKKVFLGGEAVEVVREAALQEKIYLLEKKVEELTNEKNLDLNPLS